MEVAQAAYVSTMFDVRAGIGGPLCGFLADWALGVCTSEVQRECATNPWKGLEHAEFAVFV